MRKLRRSGWGMWSRSGYGIRSWGNSALLKEPTHWMYSSGLLALLIMKGDYIKKLPEPCSGA
jgi:hypothetical protein